jgi:4-hydroxybenzoate polyprenyltransferase
MDVLNVFKITKAYIKLVRPVMILNIILWFCLGFFIAEDRFISIYELTPYIISFFLSFSFANTLNDFYDTKIDIKNDLNRPTTKNIIKPNQILFFLKILFISSIVFSIYYKTVLSTFMIIILGVLYSYPKFDFSKKGLLATFTMIFAYFFIPFWTGFLLYKNIFDIGLNIFLFFLLIVFINTPFLLFKDYRDEKGDLFYKKITPLIIFGRKGIFYISSALVFVGFLFAIFLYFNSFLSLIIIFILCLYFFNVLYIGYYSIKSEKNIYKHCSQNKNADFHSQIDEVDKKSFIYYKIAKLLNFLLFLSIILDL